MYHGLGKDALPKYSFPPKVVRRAGPRIKEAVELSPSTGCSTRKNRPCPSPGEHNRADPLGKRHRWTSPVDTKAGEWRLPPFVYHLVGCVGEICPCPLANCSRWKNQHLRSMRMKGWSCNSPTAVMGEQATYLIWQNSRVCVVWVQESQTQRHEGRRIGLAPSCLLHWLS